MEFELQGTGGPITGHNDTAGGVPAGGEATGTGFHITWQHRPLGQGDAQTPAEGAFIEDLIAVLILRTEFYQDSAFACQENEDTLTGLRMALESQRARTRNRTRRGTEGTANP